MADFLNAIPNALLEVLKFLAQIVSSVISFLLSPLIALLSPLDFITPAINKVLVDAANVIHNQSWAQGLFIANELFDLKFFLDLFITLGTFFIAYWFFRAASGVVRALFNKLGFHFFKE